MGDQGLAVQGAEAERELSFREIIRRLWSNRVLIVLLPLLAITLCVIVVFATTAHDRQVVSYYIKLIGIEGGTYPNGTAFLPSDLKSAPVISELSGKFDLPADHLEKAISVNYDNPAAAGIALKYQQKLAARNLSPAIIDSINTAYADELSSAVNSGLRIEIDNALLDLSPGDATSLALAIPSTWNDIYLKRYRVLADTKLTDSAITPIPEYLSGTSRLIVAGEQLDRIENGLRLISDDNRLAAVTTVEGLSADDMKNLLTEFRTAYFNPLLAVGFSLADPVAVSQKESLQRRAEDIERQIQGIDQNLSNVLGRRQSYSSETVPAQVGPSLEQGALETVIALVKRASYLTYTEELLDKRQKLVEELSTAQSRQAAIIFRDMNGELPSPTLTTEAEMKLEALASKYKNLFSATQRQLIEASGKFYSAASTPSETSKRSQFGSPQLLIASALVGLVLATLYALLAPSILAALTAQRSAASPAIRMVASSERA